MYTHAPATVRRKEKERVGTLAFLNLDISLSGCLVGKLSGSRPACRLGSCSLIELWFFLLKINLGKSRPCLQFHKLWPCL